MPAGRGDSFIIDICDILDVFYLVAAELKVAPDDIEEDVAHRVAYMRIGVGCNPADIHFDLGIRRNAANQAVGLFILGYELLFLSGEGVKNFHYVSSPVY